MEMNTNMTKVEKFLEEKQPKSDNYDIYEAYQNLEYFEASLDDGSMSEADIRHHSSEINDELDNIINRSTELFNDYLFGEVSKEDFESAIEDAKDGIEIAQKLLK